jgi:predicted transcriptional regulator of viral defense system
MESLTGLGKADRERIGALIRDTNGVISVDEAAAILGVSSVEAAKMLSRWARKGWLSRIRRGFYIPVPIESRTADVPLEDPWLIAARLYNPCYIGGWSAAEYWNLTEQIFRTVVVLTIQKPRDRSPIVKGTNFMLRTISANSMFGLKPVWRGRVKVSVSDPSRTLVDMLSDPRLGGGIRSTADMLNNYVKSEYKNLAMLIEYAERLKNGAVFKRLGFLLERVAPDEVKQIDACRKKLTAGNTKLDPQLTADKLVTRWKIWIPINWAKERQVD